MTPSPEKVQRDQHNQERISALASEMSREGAPMVEIITAMTIHSAELLMAYAPATTSAAASQMEAWVAEKADELEQSVAMARAQRERGGEREQSDG